jgi:hypothetical protein
VADRMGVVLEDDPDAVTHLSQHRFIVACVQSRWGRRAAQT